MTLRVVAAAAAFAGAAGSSILGNCECIYQGSVLPPSLYTNYPSAMPGMWPGRFKDFPGISKYGTMCAAWDSIVGTPIQADHCPLGSDWSLHEFSWCQAPWCYVSHTCITKISSTIFVGSNTTWYSYMACGHSPNCFSSGPGGAGGRGVSGCPFDPGHEGDNMLSKAGCACMYQGRQLPADVYTRYPLNNPGAYAGKLDNDRYGTACAAWDQSPNTPWESYCPAGADWCSREYNWCQAPWCYVNASCTTKIPSSVFVGSEAAFYSYDTCLSTPDCHTMATRESDWPQLPAACPFDNADNGWQTSMLCPKGYTPKASPNAPAPSPNASASISAPVGTAVPRAVAVAAAVLCTLVV